MGRRSEHTPDVLREMIIVACEAIIARDGLAGLSAREIARVVGYSPGTIYNVFDNLDDLILQVEARMLDDLDRHLESLPESGTAQVGVLNLARAYLDFTTQRPRLWNLLFEHHLPQNMPVPAWYQGKLDQLLSRVEMALKPLIGDNDPAAAKRSARVLWAGVHGIASLSTTDKLAVVTSDDARALLDDLVRNYLVGLEGKRVKAFG
jgi:AcrR family transcriptional regulator